MGKNPERKRIQWFNDGFVTVWTQRAEKCVMKKIVVFVTATIAFGLLLLPGCSKSNKTAPTVNNDTSMAASTTNGGSATAGPVDLKIKWQTGKKYDMEMDLNQVTDINVPGQPIHQELKLTQVLNYAPVKDLDNGGHQVELEFNRQNFDLSQNGKEILNYDSSQKTPTQPDSPAAPVAAAMQAMLGVPIDYTFAADGSVEKIEGIDSLTSRITAAVPDQRQRVSLQQLFDEDTLKQYGTFSKSLPDHPVNIGDSWSSSEDINTPTGVLTVDSTFTFKDWQQHNDHNCVHFLMTGDIKSKTASAAMVGAVVKVQKGIINGEFWFDPELGMFVDGDNKQDMTLNIATRGATFTEDMKQNVEMSLLSVDP